MLVGDRLFGQIAALTRKGGSPLASIARAYLPCVPIVAFLGLLAGMLEGVGIGLLIPLVALLLADRLPAGLLGPIQALAEQGAAHGPGFRIFVIGAAMIAFIILKGIVQAANNTFMAHVDGGLARDIRNGLSARIIGLDYGFFLKNDSSSLAHIISTDSWYASEAIRALLGMVPAATTLLVFGLILLWLDWRLSMLVGVGAIVIQAALTVLERRQRRLGTEVTESNHTLWERMMTVASAIRAIRIFGQAERELERFAEASEGVRRALFRTMRLTVSVVPLVEVLISILFVAILLAAYFLGDSIPKLTAFLVLLARAQPQAHTISRSRMEFASRLASVDRVNWLLGQQARPVAGSRAIARIDKPIRFDGVSYEYPDGTTGLQHVNVTIRPGVATALVGASGAGKSSFVDLIARLAEPRSGTIYHGDEPIGSFDAESWRSHVAIAGQNVELVDATIAENIAYGVPGASRSEIEEAARAAGASSFIESLRDGYATQLGFAGLKLSGGERQRISLARALLRRPDLLILDEATSAVDALAEQEIMELLASKRWFRGALVISHRRSTLALCEDGIVLDSGRLVEAGPLRSLDYYRRMTGKS
jgi:subfamily B ATP-binding cassette protein MsbA